MPPGTYEAGPAARRGVYRLAAILALAVLWSLAPVVRLGHLNLAAAPGWARVVILAAALEGLYLAWLINAPDWATIEVVMCVFALVATAYAAAAAAAAVTPVDHPLMLGMGEVRYGAAPWCAGMVLVASLATWLCGRAATQWRRQGGGDGFD